jgi:hypothetical protein
MSLETALADNTAALRELHALLARVSIPAEAAPAPKPQARSAAPTAPTSPTVAADPPWVDAPATTAAASEPAAVTYDDVKRAIIDVSKAKGYDGALAFLGEFDAKKGPDLKPEQFAPFVARAAAILA